MFTDPRLALDYVRYKFVHCDVDGICKAICLGTSSKFEPNQGHHVLLDGLIIATFKVDAGEAFGMLPLSHPAYPGQPIPCIPADCRTEPTGTFPVVGMDPGPSPVVPASILAHAPDYKNRAWEDYEFSELGQWVHLFAKRAGHRKNAEKLQKDLTDAQNYLYMMQSKLDALYPNVQRADRLPVPRS